LIRIKIQEINDKMRKITILGSIFCTGGGIINVVSSFYSILMPSSSFSY